VDGVSAAGWEITVRGIPAPQGSKTQWGAESSKKVRPWREAVRGKAQDALDNGEQPIAGPVAVRIAFYLPRPKSHYYTGKRAGVLRDDAPDYCDKRPDVDKLVRSTLDALTSAGAYADDARVARLIVDKKYGSDTFVGAVIMLGPVPL
jgi:crossover junction endodeoxyribonuclease RusA